jgi:hypothetical protein
LKKKYSGASGGKHKGEKGEKIPSENVSVSMMQQSSNPEETPMN